jgi:hypothetical protein
MVLDWPGLSSFCPADRRADDSMAKPVHSYHLYRSTYIKGPGHQVFVKSLCSVFTFPQQCNLFAQFCKVVRGEAFGLCASGSQDSLISHDLPTLKTRLSTSELRKKSPLPNSLRSNTPPQPIPLVPNSPVSRTSACQRAHTFHRPPSSISISSGSSREEALHDATAHQAAAAALYVAQGKRTKASQTLRTKPPKVKELNP